MICELHSVKFKWPWVDLEYFVKKKGEMMCLHRATLDLPWILLRLYITLFMVTGVVCIYMMLFDLPAGFNISAEIFKWLFATLPVVLLIWVLKGLWSSS